MLAESLSRSLQVCIGEWMLIRESFNLIPLLLDVARPCCMGTEALAGLSLWLCPFYSKEAKTGFEHLPGGFGFEMV